MSGGNEVYPVRLPVKTFLIVNVGMQCTIQQSLRKNKEDKAWSDTGSANELAVRLGVAKATSSGCRGRR